MVLFGSTAFVVAAIFKQQRKTPQQKSLAATTMPFSTSKEFVYEKRKKFFSKSNSVSYENTDPLMILKGTESYLIDEKGISYLDTRNNVAHCGHCHPRIVQAVQQQIALLNTNTRYLHPIVCQLAERLVSKLPDTLDTVFFCNSGSEANDLALRLARAWSGGSYNTIVTGCGYHGHTIATLEVSPYKYETSGEYDNILSKPAPSCTFTSPGKHIWKVPCPDLYRGPFRDAETAGLQYSKFVQEGCNFYVGGGEKVRAFIIEGGMSVAGVILPPKGYLQKCIDAVHSAGGLYIADEVQTGFGRFGSCFWAFEYDGVVPDIVTVGKPFGNGMPLAAVITSRKVAASFENCNVEYFNTFGGSTCSCAAGLAVMDVIEEEKLQENALEVGSYLKNQFEDLGKTVDLIGQVRGSGLFLGIELVRDRKTLEPAEKETSWLCSQLKTKYHILTSIDGPNNNVIVVKPPMVFSKKDADYFVECFKKALTHDLQHIEDLGALSKTPT